MQTIGHIDMTTLLGFDAINGALEMRDAIDMLETTFQHEADGKTVVSPKSNFDFDGGSMRMLCAVDHQAGYLATKAYNRIRGVGVRYLVSLYRLTDGALVALVDGRLITDMRTGAASGVLARRVAIDGPVSVGIIGSGNQARAQLASLAAVYDIRSTAVYSPTAQHRENFAREMSAKLGIRIEAAASAEAAVRGRSVVVTATRARLSDPILRGEWIRECRLLCAVGNTRKQYAETDVCCFQDADLVVVDTTHTYQDSGELIAAAKDNGLPESKRATLAQIVSGKIQVPARGLISFKSVGTALQDLALAARYYELLGSRAGVPAIHDLASLR
jgi:alanine dehydrogenase